jgi:hypothetical protein
MVDYMTDALAIELAEFNARNGLWSPEGLPVVRPIAFPSWMEDWASDAGNVTGALSGRITPVRSLSGVSLEDEEIELSEMGMDEDELENIS